MITNDTKRIAIVGGGPAALFMFKRLVELGNTNLHVSIFERKKVLGSGMPYSKEGANDEHVTNVSDNEIPQIVCSVEDWIAMAPAETLEHFHINAANFNEYKVLPRLFFGEYLAAQFDLLKQKAEQTQIQTQYHLGTNVTDISFDRKSSTVKVRAHETDYIFDKVIICTGHYWPKKHEGRVPNYFDSPYPPAKLRSIVNQSVAVRGSSLTAIDAIRTLARNNGHFEKNNGKVTFVKSPEASHFKIVMHSRNGLLPAVRFHLEDSHLTNENLLSKEEILAYKDQHDGFLSLDYLFENDFKALIRLKDADFYEKIKGLSIEEFVELVMEMRERLDSFTLLKAEYKEAAKSIRNKKSIYWKEMLAVLSFAMNYPAKYLPAEDMLRLKKTLMPLITIVIAFIPQSSCEELLALHEAGVLDIVAVGSDGEIELNRAGGITYVYTDENSTEQSQDFEAFVDCIGQPHLSFDDFPFGGLVATKTVNPARLRFQSEAAAQREIENGNKAVYKDAFDHYYMTVSGLSINDNFQALDEYGAFNDQVYIMAVPFIGGLNPDYSGLDFCEEASGRIIDVIEKELSNVSNLNV